MNAPSRPDSAPRLEDFPCQVTDNVRYADLDTNGHVNNGAFATYFETGRATLNQDSSVNLHSPGHNWVMVRLDIHFRAELHWPATVNIGLGVAKLGRSSVTYDQAVFSEGRCVASAQSVMVLIDTATRRPAPLNDKMIGALQRLLKRGAGAT